MLEKEIKIGIIALISFLLTIWGLNFLKGKNIFNSSAYYYSVYQNVDGMDVAAPVRINGLTVGKVTEIYFHPNNSGKIIVKFDLRKDFAIPKNSIARIYNSDLMGSKAIQIELGSSFIYFSFRDLIF